MSSAGRLNAPTQRAPSAYQPARVAGLAWFMVVAAMFTAPAWVLGATPEVSGSPSPAPDVNPLEQILGVVAPLIGIGVALGVTLAVVVGIAFVVARIGGRPSAPAPAIGTAPARSSRWILGGILSVVVVVVAMVLGVLGGREVAYYGSLGGLGGVLGAGILTFFIVAMVIALTLVGLIAMKIRHGKANLAIRTLLAAAGLLSVGAIGGDATAGALGGLYRQPVVLGATGETHAALQADATPFVARDGGRADCRSVPDGRSVETVTALEVGRLGSGALRATLSLAASGSDGASAEFWIADVPDGTIQPFWRGNIQIIESAPDGASGRMSFNLERAEDGASKSEPSARTSPPPGWPPTLAGELSWTCQPW